LYTLRTAFIFEIICSLIHLWYLKTLAMSFPQPNTETSIVHLKNSGPRLKIVQNEEKANEMAYNKIFILLHLEMSFGKMCVALYIMDTIIITHGIEM